MTAPDANLPQQDERIMAALAHISAFLPMMGLIAPVLIWLLQKDKSPFVRFQALQAIAYQIAMLVAYFLGMGCYMVFFFLTFFTLPFAGSEGLSGVGGIVALVLFLLPVAVMGLMFLGGLAFISYAVVAAVATIRGRHFRYAILGAKIERFLEPGGAVAPTGL